MATWRDGRHIPVHIPLFVALVLVVYLPRTSTKRKEIPHILPAQADNHIPDVAVRHCAGNMGKVQ